MGKVHALLRLYAARDAMAAPVLEGRIECKSGCSHCCYQIIGVTMAEAKVIAGLQVQWDERLTRERDIAVFNEHCKTFKSCDGLSDKWRGTKTGCFFLTGDTCDIYDARPLMCRLHNSQNASDCEWPPSRDVRSVIVHHDSNFVRLANIQWGYMTAKERTLPEFKKAGNLYFLPAAMLWALGEMKESELKNEFLTADAETGSRPPRRPIG